MAYYIRGLVNVQNACETGGLFLPKIQFSNISHDKQDAVKVSNLMHRFLYFGPQAMTSREAHCDVIIKAYNDTYFLNISL